MTVRNKVEVKIAGKDYTLVGSEPDEYIQKVGLYVDKKMTEVLRSNNRLSTAMAAVLTAINVADDYFKAHEEIEGIKLELERLQEEYKALKDERGRLKEENTALSNKNTSLQLELAKREAELREVRNSMDKITKRETR